MEARFSDQESYDGPSLSHEVWVADFTYIKIDGDFMYFSTVMDLHTRKIVGIEVSKRRNVDMVLNTIKKGIIPFDPFSGLNPKVKF
ncbi:DDE-type integrase/transposase/recombinase [Candidatus Vondammii sp. HM_W22]|uniref:DDE-type integrase/transposase/recombinase n=1 Tax=Candidatus Vondammii sp. HM_W22 TaxID=2687299 RepID=UPI002E7BA2E8|nr:DDE-type integrase/transposase/recombinase [Candidatus Vondammii sp. HM_W22]